MFSSKKQGHRSHRPRHRSAAPAKRAPRPSAPSIISADLVITGTLTSTGDMQIDGRVEGDVRSIGLVIGEKAEIHGEICAPRMSRSAAASSAASAPARSALRDQPCRRRYPA